MTTKNNEAWQERRRLEAQPARIAEADAETNRKKQLLDKETAQLAKELERVRYQRVTEGASASLEKKMAELDARLAAVPGEQQRLAEMFAATVSARRLNERQRHHHVKEHMDTFSATLNGSVNRQKPTSAHWARPSRRLRDHGRLLRASGMCWLVHSQS